MYSREDNDQPPEKRVVQHDARCGLSGISTERIMRAVHEQRRVSQQLEDLRWQQKQRTAQLRSAGLKLVCVLWSVSGTVVGGYLLLLLLRPALLDRTLNSLDDSIAVLVMLSEQIRQGVALVPASSWLLSVAALVVVLLMCLWIRLMRYPQDA